MFDGASSGTPLIVLTVYRSPVEPGTVVIELDSHLEHRDIRIYVDDAIVLDTNPPSDETVTKPLRRYARTVLARTDNPATPQ
ncbi:hypothetical protein [Nocardia blacklockiae]|uniref:hypothetical protein n=1 Tax=Nocardia blacklockiae TaxID=480036 RepID=UPI0018945C7C|nr:hypothetical protein [Nocardia blacklockiae]MBF6171104.1 hypothetical protein [Nocardia blacklockiae]